MSKGSKAIKCDRCGKRCRNPEGWNGVFRAGVMVGALCPDCQSPEENAEAEIREATVNYGRDELGRATSSPKHQ